MLGFVFAAGMGVSSTALAEYFDTSIRDLQGLKKISSIPVLGAIPYVRTKRDIVKRVIMRLFLLLGFVAAACVFLTLLHLYYMPLDILWLKLQETIGLQ